LKSSYREAKNGIIFFFTWYFISSLVHLFTLFFLHFIQCIQIPFCFRWFLPVQTRIVTFLIWA
jgi:hypothetical protein